MKSISKGIIVEITYNTVIISISFIHGGQLCNIQTLTALYIYVYVYRCICSKASRSYTQLLFGRKGSMKHVHFYLNNFSSMHFL